MEQITHTNTLQYALTSFAEQETNRLERIEEELEGLPEGSLYMTETANKIFFIHAVNGRRLGISGNRDLIHKLARKRYLKLLLSEQRQALSAIVTLPGVRRRTLSDRNPYTERISRFLSQCLRAGLDLQKITCSESQLLWANGQYISNPSPYEGVVYTTLSGNRVRTKSEQIIANALERNGVPYRLEQGLRLPVSWMPDVPGRDDAGYKTYYPAFCILTRLGTLIIWEHLDRLDLAGYRSRCMEKISAYRQNGYCSEDQLIITFEKDLEDAAFLDQLIAERILPYL